MRFLIVGLLVLAPLVGLQAQTIRYIHTDALGSVAVVTDANRNVIERREYEPYGAVLTGVKDGPGYTGHVLDAVTGMSYMQQRYYDPAVGRMLSRDPITAYDNSDLRFFNSYAYAFNNPYRFSDSDGRAPSCEACNKLVEEAKAEAISFVAQKTVAFSRALSAEGKAAFESGKQDLRNYVSQRDVVASVGIAGMLGTPVGPNAAPLGLTALGDLGVVANLSSGQIGLQANLGLVPSVGGGAVASGNFQGGLNNGPLETGFSTANVAFAQATAVTATGTPLDVGGAVQWSSGGASVSAGFKPGVGSYLGVGGGKVYTGTLVTPPLWEKNKE
ncbi:RHS repeat-associated core domain-containing protein [Pseudoxanthomonas winnipegensis]|uniref:RHS repeat-associated core domain-containing protein n=1 Tax=Pseudoxanthomonas winnipegensis TaxID=2480810 RepID=UPI001F1C7E1E|nr:RHS repeat-associated core domain-containing protein [Pseudoxanthomonas winnipegensis]